MSEVKVYRFGSLRLMKVHDMAKGRDDQKEMFCVVALLTSVQFWLGAAI